MPELLWQPWTAISGVPATPVVVQSPEDWLDVSDVREAVFRIDALELTGTLSLQSAQGAQGPWTAFASVTGATRSVVVVRSSEPGAAANLQRYVRWVLEPPGATFLTTFQISAVADNVEAVRRARRDQGATIQPWVAVNGTFTATGDDIIIPPESQWLDTSRIDYLFVEAEMVDQGGGSSLVVETSMSLDGPWTGVLTVATAYAVQSVKLSSEASATNPLMRYLRWHVESTTNDWGACFRVTGRWS